MPKTKIPVPKSILVPREAYRFWPEPSDIVRGSGKKLVRFIFEYQTLTDFESKKLSEFLKEIQSSKFKGYSLPPEWSENHLLRFLYGAKWEIKCALKMLKSNLDWRKSVIPNSYKDLYSKVVLLLVTPIKASGVFYIHGRDCKYRPLLVLNFAKVNFKEVRKK